MNLQAWGAWLSGPAPAEAPAAARQAAVRTLVDTLGVAYAGATAPEAAPVLAYLQAYAGRGPVPVPGTGLRLPAEQGALALGLLAHALDYDDSNALIKLHPSAVLWSAVLAAGCASRAPGAALLDAYIAGFQVLGRVGRLVGEAHYARGWHNTSTLGSLGAAAAAARVLGLDAAATAHALGLAASMAAGLRANFGTPAKPLHSGLAARNGVLAAQLAALGLGAHPGALAGPTGFGAVLGGDPLDPAAGPEGDGAWELLSLGVDVKPWPCCAAAHRSMAAARTLREAPGFDPAAVLRVECLVHPHIPTVLVYHRPATGLEAKFSLAYCVAAVLRDGDVGRDHFTDAAVRRPDLLALVERTRTGVHPEQGGRNMADGHFAEVQVHLAGEAAPRVARCDLPPGDARRPFPDQWLGQKFLDCTRDLGARAPVALAQCWRVQDHGAGTVLGALQRG